MKNTYFNGWIHRFVTGISVLRRTAGLAIVAGALLVGGCLPSINPLYTDKDLVFDPALIGTWTEKPDGTDYWRFSKRDEQSYALVIGDDGKSSPFIAHLLKLGEQRFLDLQPDKQLIDGLKTEGVYKSLIVRGHLFLRVDQIGPELRMAATDRDWFTKFLKENPGALGHTRESDDELILTAPTKDLQAFILKHLKTEGAWGDAMKFMRRANTAGEKK